MRQQLVEKNEALSRKLDKTQNLKYKYMKKSVKIFTVIVLSSILMVGCDVLQQMVTFSKCEFKMNSLTNTRIAGVDVQSKPSFKSLSFMDAANLTKSLLGGTLPLTFNLNIEVKNPNPTTAAMQRMDWKLFIDDVEMTTGILNKKVSIEPNQSQIVPLSIALDLKKVLAGKSKNALLNFGFNLAGAGKRPSRVKLSIKPTVSVGSFPITYPGYFTLKKEFGSGNN